MDSRGSRLLEFTTGEAVGGAPLAGSLVMLRSGGRLLLVFNRFRGEWEMPGGTIESDETPEQAARRELFEESGQIADTVTRAGTARFALAGSGTEEACAMFVARASTTTTFAPTDEIGAICWWDGSVDPPGGQINPIDRMLIDLVGA